MTWQPRPTHDVNFVAAPRTHRYRAHLLNGGDPDAAFNLSLMPNGKTGRWPQGQLGHPSDKNPDAHPKWDDAAVDKLRDAESTLAGGGVHPEHYLDPRNANAIRTAVENDMHVLGHEIEHYGNPSSSVPTKTTTWKGQTRDILASLIPPIAIGVASQQHDDKERDEKN